MKQVAEVEEMLLVFSRLAEEMRRQLSREVLTDANRGLWSVGT
jgi:hypothetical protein